LRQPLLRLSLATTALLTITHRRSERRGPRGPAFGAPYTAPGGGRRARPAGVAAIAVSLSFAATRKNTFVARTRLISSYYAALIFSQSSPIPHNELPLPHISHPTLGVVAREGVFLLPPPLLPPYSLLPPADEKYNEDTNGNGEWERGCGPRASFVLRSSIRPLKRPFSPSVRKKGII
jgi:hypothetical protein